MKLWALYECIDDGYHVMRQLFESEQDALDSAAKSPDAWEPPYVKAVYVVPKLNRTVDPER